MRIESIKLSPKKGGNGYVSGYSISIAEKEAKTCQLTNGRVFKCIDAENHEIVIRAKHYTLTDNIIQKVCQLMRAANQEEQQINKKYCKTPRRMTMDEGIELWYAYQTGKEFNRAEDNLQKYLSSLSVESIVDLTLLMYIGRDFDADMNKNPGEERFLEFYDRYNDIVLGQEKDRLIDIIMEKMPLPIYLESGVRILRAPIGTNINDLPGLDWSEFNSEISEIF